MTKNSLLFLFTIISCFYIVSNEIINPKLCAESSDQCTISEVIVNPCKANPKPCRVPKGVDTLVSFTILPQFKATKLKTMVYWVGSVVMQFPNFDDDGCKLTACPTVAGVPQQYNYTLNPGKKLPSGNFPIRWKVWNEEDESQSCCFETSIRLIK